MIDNAYCILCTGANHSYIFERHGEESTLCLYGWWRRCPFTYTVPSTKHLTDDLTRPQSSEYLYGYSYSGFLTLQQTIDQFIFLQQGIDVNITASIGLMPTASYTTDQFKEVITPTLGIFYMLSFLFPVSRIVRALVHEKETRIREGMRMMGLASNTYNVSWLIVLLLQMALTSLLMTRSASESIFQYSEDSLVFIYFLSFSLSLVSLCCLIATFFSKAKTAALVGPIIFFASFFPYYAVSDTDLSASLKLFACLSPTVCFILGGDVFMEFETGLVGVRVVQRERSVGGRTQLLDVHRDAATRRSALRGDGVVSRSSITLRIRLPEIAFLPLH